MMTQMFASTIWFRSVLMICSRIPKMIWENALKDMMNSLRECLRWILNACLMKEDI